MRNFTHQANVVDNSNIQYNEVTIMAQTKSFFLFHLISLLIFTAIQQLSVCWNTILDVKYFFSITGVNCYNFANKF